VSKTVLEVENLATEFHVEHGVALAVVRTVNEFSTRKLLLQNGDADAVLTDRSFLPQLADVPGVRLQDRLPYLEVQNASKLPLVCARWGRATRTPRPTALRTRRLSSRSTPSTSGSPEPGSKASSTTR